MNDIPLCRRFFLIPVLCLILFLCGCSGQEKNSGSMQTSYTYTPGKTQVLVPQSGTGDLVSSGSLTLDFSHMDQGYFIGSLNGSGQKISIQLTGPDGVEYHYFLESPQESAVFPFTAGDGNYLVLAFECVGNDTYASLLSHSLTLTLENEFLPFLYPNQYVSFSADSQAVSLAADLSEHAETDLDALTAVYEYVTSHLTYDDEKAASVETGYLPDIDETLASGTGICFDYAALTASMLRSLAIPARLDIGYMGEIRHAWIDVYIQSRGWVEHAVEFNGDQWNFLDPTYASALKGTSMADDYTGDGSSYVVQYIR